MLQPDRIPVDRRRFGGDRNGVLARLALLIEGDLLEVDRLPIEHQLARGVLGNVQQVVEQPREVERLAPDDLLGAAELLGDLGENGDGVADGAQWIADLVPQHGQELVLGAIGGLGFGPGGPLRGEAPGVLDARAARSARRVRIASSRSLNERGER